MRLTRIKIAGFKSFVDPTELKMPGSLVGIVGPNGCGKSNTIDAVRWVMGESSAKHLRGESMDDVIFNGSSQRKPVGSASVELIFDNNEGRLGGEYAQFSEISIRREASRDGTSKYFLNNTRCRRRDIRDIFLGTGLGPRSYAIIEQGMVSRLIEAKPEDLRVYLEEAAGISKYKERRRETENRIRHTRDNLDRLNDLIEEVDKQLDKLKRQASTAERFQVLNAELRSKKGELLLLRRREFEVTRERQNVSIAEKEKELEAIIAELRAEETAIERAREQRESATQSFNQIQADFYRIGADVSKIEQSIEHTKATRRQQNQDLADVEKSLDEATRHVDEDQKRIAEIDESMSVDQPQFDALKNNQKVQAEVLTQAETQRVQWQERSNTHRSRRAEFSQTAQVERSRMDQLERSVEQNATRLARLDEEKQGSDFGSLEKRIATLIAEEVIALNTEQKLKLQAEQSGEKQLLLREEVRRKQVQVNESTARVQSSLGRLASLEALQQAALNNDTSAGDAWLVMHELEAAPRLAQQLTIETGWEKAVELVLGPSLEAVCVDDADILQRCLNDLPAAQLTLLAQSAAQSMAISAQDSLLSKVQNAGAVRSWLSRVKVAETLKDAQQLRAELDDDESVITRDGVWLGKHWLRIARADAEDSVLIRENEITELRAIIDELEETVQSEQSDLLILEDKLGDHEARRDTLQHSLNDAVRALADIKSNLHAQQQELTQLSARQQQIDGEGDELRAQLNEDRQALAEATRAHASAAESLEEMAADDERLQAEQSELDAALSEAKARVEQERNAGQELAIRVESMKSARVATEQNLQRMQTRIQELSERRDSLNNALVDDTVDPLIALEASLNDMLTTRSTSEESLNIARQAVHDVDGRLRDHEQSRVKHDQQSQLARESLQAERMATQESVVRLKTLDEQLDEHDYNVDELSEHLVAEANVSEWEQAVSQLEQKISRLGPINLAAIDEHAEQSTRKEYLDEQHADVTEALETLERAIAKIDRETRARFKETFEAVNAKFEAFFPRLFGGGKASLQLTGDDLLSTGVSVFAQPPGKRINNLQLLSGGEKALTAVSLVFAFFELNPSPFCMLDEVDAPLDDANVGRFCQLVREMSERVQFIIITHNKVTMELSDQLMGVTMNEPGVSRLVAVDVEAAVELAGV